MQNVLTSVCRAAVLYTSLEVLGQLLELCVPVHY